MNMDELELKNLIEQGLTFNTELKHSGSNPD
jgi:hypothetical protein